MSDSSDQMKEPRQGSEQALRQEVGYIMNNMRMDDEVGRKASTTFYVNQLLPIITRERQEGIRKVREWLETKRRKGTVIFWLYPRDIETLKRGEMPEIDKLKRQEEIKRGN